MSGRLPLPASSGFGKFPHHSCSMSATCLGDGYSVDCTRPGDPPSDGGAYLYSCTCKKAGAFVKTVDVQNCDFGPGGLPALCGWPADTPGTTCTIGATNGCTHEEHVSCTPVDGGAFRPLSECQCFEDGVVTATVSADCRSPISIPNGAWRQCGFPIGDPQP